MILLIVINSIECRRCETKFDFRFQINDFRFQIFVKLRWSDLLVVDEKIENYI